MRWSSRRLRRRALRHAAWGAEGAAAGCGGLRACCEGVEAGGWACGVSGLRRALEAAARMMGKLKQAQGEAPVGEERREEVTAAWKAELKTC